MKLDIQKFTKKCSCNHEHKIDVKDIVIESQALSKIPEYLLKYGYCKPTMICDENTYQAAGYRVEQVVKLSGKVILSPDHLHANEFGVEAAREQLSEQSDVMIAVGSGTIHDITRYIAYEQKIPFISVPTAASVDGFVSTVAAMTWKGMKKSFTAVSPICVIADSEVIAKAPYRLTASGISDLFGKYTALVDWKLGHILLDEYICGEICNMEYEAIHEVRCNLENIRDGKEEGYEALMYGLLLSGLAMQMVGNSRPASGAEHHLSHVWEMALLNSPTEAYHGEKVGVGLCIATGIYRNAALRLQSGEFKWNKKKETVNDVISKYIKEEAIKEELRQENASNPLELITEENFRAHKEEILELLLSLPTKEEMLELLSYAGAPTTLSEIGVEETVLFDSIRLSPYIRKRLTFMRFLKAFDFYDDLKQLI